MEFNKIKANGCDVHTLFDGGHYYFYNHFFGLVAYAERDKENETHFILHLDNYHIIGSNMYSAIATQAKKFITKCENQFAERHCTYEEVREATTKDYYFNIELIKR